MKTANFLIIPLIILLIIPVILIVKETQPRADEWVHLDQIQKFAQGSLTLNVYLTTIPGYHLFLALLAILFKNTSISFIRILTFLISLLSIPVFYLMAKNISLENSGIKTLQYIFFPILFPFFFLIYTDVFSLLLIMLALLLAVKKQYSLSALTGISSIAARQNNIVWFLFLYIFIYFNENSIISKESIKQHLRKTWLFIPGFILFIIFIIINKGIALGDKSMHPSSSIHFGNIYFLLFLFFFLFLPHNLANLPKIIQKIKQKPIIIPVILAILLIYLLTFTNTHPYNQAQYTFYLRNLILIYFTSSPYLKIIFFIPIAYSILSLITTKLQKKPFNLIYPATILYLIPSWLIEQRYYLIPFMLFLACKETKGKTEEYLTLAAYIILSYVLFYGILKQKFFI